MHGNMSICITLEYREKAFRETTLFIVERRAINPIYNYRIVIDLSVVMLVKLTHSPLTVHNVPYSLEVVQKNYFQITHSIFPAPLRTAPLL